MGPEWWATRTFEISSPRIFAPLHQMCGVPRIANNSIAVDRQARTLVHPSGTSCSPWKDLDLRARKPCQPPTRPLDHLTPADTTNKSSSHFAGNFPSLAHNEIESISLQEPSMYGTAKYGTANVVCCSRSLFPVPYSLLPAPPTPFLRRLCGQVQWAEDLAIYPLRKSMKGETIFAEYGGGTP